MDVPMTIVPTKEPQRPWFVGMSLPSRESLVVTRQFRVPTSWARRYFRRILELNARACRYRRGTMVVWGVEGFIRHDDTTDIAIKFLPRPILKTWDFDAQERLIAKSRRRYEAYSRGDLRKVLKMLTVAQAKLRKAAA